MYDRKEEKDYADKDMDKIIVGAGYLKSLIKENMSKIDFVGDISVSGEKLHVKIIVITRGHAQSTQKKEIIKKILRLLKKHENDALHNFVQLVITEHLGREIYMNIKNICPIGRLEIIGVSVI